MPMSASQQLEADYGEWERLAEAEGEAIRAENWMRALECQTALQQLQPRIVALNGRAQQEREIDGDSRALSEPSLRALIARVIELEQRNFELLDSRLGSARNELSKLQTANHTLHRLQRSYAPTRPAAWTSFS